MSERDMAVAMMVAAESGKDEAVREITMLLLRSTNGRQWKRQAARWACEIIGANFPRASREQINGIGRITAGA